jgi:cytochrome c oxidase subunit 6b
MISVIEPMLHL